MASIQYYIHLHLFNVIVLNKPVFQTLKQGKGAAEPTYASWGGRDVASILQRRKYLMGVGDHSDYSSASDSEDDGQWD